MGILTTIIFSPSSCFARFQRVLHSLLQTEQPEYGQLEGHKLQLHLLAILVDDCPELGLKTSLWSCCLGSASNTQPSIWRDSNVPASVEQSQPTFFFSFFSAGPLLHPSDLECCYTRKQHRRQAFSLSKLFITALTREILVWCHESCSTQTQFDIFFTW